MPSSQDEAFRQSLRELGWIDGQNVMIEYRWAEGNPDQLPVLVAELVQAKAEVIVVSGNRRFERRRMRLERSPLSLLS